MSSKIDSRTILDQQGAEQFLGHGDMLFLAPGTGAPLRVHGAFDDDKEVKVAKEIGKFYQAKKDWVKAIKYYEMHLKNTNDDMETILLLMQAYTENLQFDKLAKASDEQMQLFPSQPQLYYYNGLANNQLKNYKKAKDVLEAGIDFVIDDKALEINFNLQLGEAYNGLGDMKKKEFYFLKANSLIEKQKK